MIGFDDSWLDGAIESLCPRMAKTENPWKQSRRTRFAASDNDLGKKEDHDS